MGDILGILLLTSATISKRKISLASSVVSSARGIFIPNPCEVYFHIAGDRRYGIFGLAINEVLQFGVHFLQSCNLDSTVLLEMFSLESLELNLKLVCIHIHQIYWAGFC